MLYGSLIMVALCNRADHYILLMVKTGQFTTQCKDDNVICLKRQISFLLVD